MYYPYLRGKRFELLALRECAETIAQSGFVPIIEPVRQPLRRLKQTIEDLLKKDANTIVVANPKHGDYRDRRSDIDDLMAELHQASDKVHVGILLTSEMSEDEVRSLLQKNVAYDVVLIDYGFKNTEYLTGDCDIESKISLNIFIDGYSGNLYRKRYFNSIPYVLIQDGFKRKKNANYEFPSIERFSDLHVTYKRYDMKGYGDFLTVGDDYSERGGPAYAVAIHLTYIDPDQDDEMFVQHFVSDTNDTPTDPAGKFAEALEKLVEKVESNDSCFKETAAISEFRELHKEQHFPGLGYIKKLSMKHHIETLANYQRREGGTNA